jgi:phosphoribosylglycinamide formyltransferase 1
VSPPGGRIAVLASGTGTNLRALLDASRAPASPYSVVVVGTDKPDAGALAHAAAFDVPTVVVPRRRPPDRAAHDRAMVEALAPYEPDWVCLAGYMRLVTPVFLAAFPGRILNIHPALLPAFPGMHAQRQAFDAGVRIAGCTVHLVTEQTDAGPIVAQAAVPVLPDDDAETLRLRILSAEHLLYPRAVRWAAEGRLRLVDGRVQIDLPPGDTTSLLLPDGFTH